MPIVGTVESLWRYPVKSMRGEELNEMFAGYAGVYGDRLFAFTSSASPERFPFFTGREQRQMLRYQPRFRNPEKATRPINQMEADSLPPGVTSSGGFAENDFVGKSLRIGSKVVVSVLERDPRCMMITLDPDTAEKTPVILKQVAQAHEGMAGVYGAVLIEGTIRKGDAVELLD